MRRRARWIWPGDKVSRGHRRGTALALRSANADIALQPASVFGSAMVALPDDPLRIGFGHATFGAGLTALSAATNA